MPSVRTIRRRRRPVAAAALVACTVATSLLLPGTAGAGDHGGGRDDRGWSGGKDWTGGQGGQGGRKGPVFDRLATFPVFQNSADPTAETVAEITAVSADGATLISTDSPGERVTFTDITDPSHPVPAVGGPDGSLPSWLEVGGEPTSVGVFGEFALIAVNTSAGFTEPSGRLLVVRVADRSLVSSIELGGQPDSVAVSPAGATGGDFAAIAIENERDEEVDYGEIPQAPGGSLVLIDLDGDPAGWQPRAVDLTTAMAGVSGIVAPEDPEPEYVSINPANQIAVTLQENNGIAVVEAATGTVRTVFSAGTVDLDGVDTVEDGAIDLTGSLTAVPREPDAIAWVGDGLVATANEGDLAGGSRGWTVFDAATGAVRWDSGTELEELAVSVGLYPESRSENKGVEPEGLAVGTFRGRPYAFVGSERGNFVAVYDVSRPTEPRFVQVLPTTNGPEGLLPISARDLFVVSSEVDEPEGDVRSSITVFGVDRGRPEFPTIVSREVDGRPLGWGALSALTADPRRSSRLWSVSDSSFTPTHLFSIDTDGEPAVIRTAVTLTEGGAPIGVDAEGLLARPQGGFWLAVEGATGPENQILLVDRDGAVQRRIDLPAEITAALGSQGLEGITATTGRRGGEQVYVALQRPLSTDATDEARIGRLDVASGAWTWYRYPLDQGSTVGLSELTGLGDGSFAVIERDNQAGPSAAVKRLYRFELPADPNTPISKGLARDLLPDLQATNGWTQEKVEGLAVGGDRRVYLVTDNDAVEDATGETVFLDLGSRRQVFGR